MKNKINKSKPEIEKRDIKLAIINSGLINEDGWICTGTESSDFSDEFEIAVNNLIKLLSTEDKEVGK